MTKSAGIWAIISARPVRQGKRHLAPVLTAGRRRHLNNFFCRNTLETVCAVLVDTRFVQTPYLEWLAVHMSGQNIDNPSANSSAK